MEELLKGSGVEDLLTGGLSKGVAFVRKSMAKTKQINKGYKPPARWGYDFDVATEKDKPSKHIQINIGEVKPEDVVKYKYQRRKKSEEEKEREAVHKFSYWGLTKDDFKEVDGQLIEKKHGLIWGPIYYQPAGREKGVWGLRCCRYDKDGEKIPSSQKYEYLYVKDDGDEEKEEEVASLFPNTGERWKDGEWVNTIDLAKADPPDEIVNTNDEEDEVMLKRYFAKGRTEQRFAFGEKLTRRRRPFFWFKSSYNKTQRREVYEEVYPNADTITYKDIPTIISANRVMRQYIKGASSSKYYGADKLIEQQKRWETHLDGLKQRVRLTGTRVHLRDDLPKNNYRDIASKEDRDKYVKDLQSKINDLQSKIENTATNARFRRTVKTQFGKRTVEGREKIVAYRDRQDFYRRLMATALQGIYTKKEIDYGTKVLRNRNFGPIEYDGKRYTQKGVQMSMATGRNNRWGQARAEMSLEKLEDRLEELNDRIETLNFVITLNEALIRKLVKNPLNLPLSEVANIVDSDERKSDPDDIDREQQKELMKKAEKKVKGKEEEEEEGIDLGDAIEE